MDLILFDKSVRSYCDEHISWKVMDYKIINWDLAADLKGRQSTKEIKVLDFNLATMYLLADSSYLITPLNPFGNGVVVRDTNLLNKWINEESFPVDDSFSTTDFKKMIEIENFVVLKDSLKKEIFDFCQINYENGENLSEGVIDGAYDTLKRKKKIKKYRLNFVVLLGDYIIKRHSEKSYRWGLLRSKQLLNPITSLVIIKDRDKNLYFDIESEVEGKAGYLGIGHALYSFGRFSRKGNEIDEIVKIF